jgi:hypothetical protein
MYEAILGLMLKAIDPLYKWISENMVVHFLAFGKEFGAVIVFISAIVFLLITMYLIMKQAKRLPNRYVLETYDQDGKSIVIPELRIVFATYQAAASYAEFYSKLYEGKYRFKLVGVKDKISVSGLLNKHEIRRSS